MEEGEEREGQYGRGNQDEEVESQGGVDPRHINANKGGVQIRGVTVIDKGLDHNGLRLNPRSMNGEQRQTEQREGGETEEEEVIGRSAKNNVKVEAPTLEEVAQHSSLSIPAVV